MSMDPDSFEESATTVIASAFALACALANPGSGADQLEPIVKAEITAVWDRLQGNRPDGALMAPGDWCIITASTFKRCAEIIEGAHCE